MTNEDMKAYARKEIRPTPGARMFPYALEQFNAREELRKSEALMGNLQQEETRDDR